MNKTVPDYWSARAAITKYHRLGGLKSKNVFSLGSGGQKSEIRMLAGLASSENSFLGLQVTLFSFTLFSLHLHIGSSLFMPVSLSPFLIRAPVGRARWLMSVVPAFWEAKAGGS